MQQIIQYITIIILSLIPLLVKAQGGSNYSIFGIGDLHNNVGAYYDAMAGTSIAVPAEQSVNTVNPAMWSSVSHTLFQAGYRFNQHINNDGSLTLRQNNGKISGFFILFSVDSSKGIAASLGIQPYSSFNYLIERATTINDDGTQLFGTNTYQGIGGIYQGYIGASFNIFDNLSVGAHVNALFGKSETGNITQFNSPYYLSSANITKNSYSGISFKSGFRYELFNSFNIAGFYESSSKLKINSELRVSSQLLGDSILTCTDEITLPQRYGFGISYQTGKFILAADASFRDFSTFSYVPNEIVKYKQSSLISFGLIRIGNKSFNASIWDKMSYKFGVGQQDMYYEIDGNGISELFASVGASIPLPGQGFIETAITIGKRGSNKAGIIEEFFGRLSIDLTIGETWFKPFKREY